MTSHRIGVNLRVSGNCDQGARKYMEDNHVIRFLKKDTDDYEFAYFGIFDGHGGPEASAFCKDNLLNEITKYEGFWTDNDEQVLAAIRKGFLDTHQAMWNVLDTWPKTVSGLPSTAGSTATIAIIKQGKLYTGHVGDSALVLGENSTYTKEVQYQAICITKEHKPDDPHERLRIKDAGGEVISKSGVPRIVWSRPKLNHKGPVRRSTHLDQIPFLAVARSLGDLWSYDYYTETYVVSPDPDVSMLKLDPSKHRCIILASDGLWNMLTPEDAVVMVMDLENQFEHKIISDPNVAVTFWSNPAERLVSRALNKWRSKSLKADNTSCVVVLIDPLGPSKLTLLRQKRQALLSSGEITTQFNKVPPKLSTDIDYRNKNSNCSLSESHVRSSDDSILRLLTEDDPVPMLRQSFTALSNRSKIKGSDEDYHSNSMDDNIEDISRLPNKWDLRHSVEDKIPERSSSVKISNTSENISKHSDSCPSPTKSNARLYRAAAFTKLVEAGKVTCGEIGNKHKQMMQLKHLKLSENVLGFTNDMEVDEIEVEENETDSDCEKWLLRPPPSTPCSGNKEQAVSKDNGENLRQSSTNVTDQTFSLISDESIQSPDSSYGEDNCPPTPSSAPARLSMTRTKRESLSKISRKKLMNNRLQGNLSKPCLGLDATKSVDSLLPDNSDGISTVASEANDPLNGSETAKCNDMSKLVSAVALSKEVQAKSKTSSDQVLSPPKKLCTRKVLNTSKSMNDVLTPKNHKEALKSTSCTTLTPGMSLLMSEISRSVLSNKLDACARYNVTKSSTKAADSGAASAPRFKQETSLVKDGESISLAEAEPLRQLNKTGPIHKMGSKRWGSFLRVSKQGIDQMFHLGSQRRGAGRLITTSTGQLECGSSKVVSGTKTTASASRLPDLTVTSHLQDTSLLADLTVTASSIAAGDLTNLSTLSQGDSMLSATGITLVCQSMLDVKDLPAKIHKRHKSFLQKTRRTIRKASRAAKKAFFPENNQFFHKPAGTKRRSSASSPTPEVKRRKQLHAERS